MISHISLVHEALRKHIKKGDTVVDATCGNGHDSLLLAQLATDSHNGHVFCIDIQEDALKATEKRLKNAGYSRFSLVHGSHEQLPSSFSVIVYNLGYLPGGNTAITTKTKSTLQSLENALSVLSPGGLIAITLYPGHPEGKLESEKVELWARNLPQDELNLFLYKDIFSPTKPYVLFLKKRFRNRS